MADSGELAPATQVKQWSTDEIGEALAHLVACGGNVNRAAKELSVKWGRHLAESTLRFWRDRPMTREVRATAALREELFALGLERLRFRLLRSARGKIREAKLASVMNGIGLASTHLRQLRADLAGRGTVGPDSGGLDLSQLSADELRQFSALVAKASGQARDDEPRMVSSSEGSGDSDDGSRNALPGGEKGASEGRQAIAYVQRASQGGRVGVPEAGGQQGEPALSGGANSENSGL